MARQVGPDKSCPYVQLSVRSGIEERDVIILYSIAALRDQLHKEQDLDYSVEIKEVTDVNSLFINEEISSSIQLAP